MTKPRSSEVSQESQKVRSPPVDTGPSMVVGIGASAGGLKALQQFVEAVPADSGLAFVVILHLDPDIARRLRVALRDALREIGEDPGG